MTDFYISFIAFAIKCWVCSNKVGNADFCGAAFNASKLSADEIEDWTMECGDGEKCVKLYARLHFGCEYLLLSFCCQ